MRKRIRGNPGFQGRSVVDVQTQEQLADADLPTDLLDDFRKKE